MLRKVLITCTPSQEADVPFRAYVQREQQQQQQQHAALGMGSIAAPALTPPPVLYQTRRDGRVVPASTDFALEFARSKGVLPPASQ